MSDRLGTPSRRRVRRWRFDLRRWLCGHDLHWPVRFDRDARPYMGEPPEPGWYCDFCGHSRPPYRWPLWLARGFFQRPVEALRLGRDYWGRPW